MQILKIALAIVLLAANCALAEDLKFEVGAILPLTGMVASMGQATKNGIVLFTEREPAKSEKIKFIYEDSKYDGKETLTALNKLAKVDRASLVMVWGNTPSDVAEPVAQSYKLDTVFVSHDDHSSKSQSNLDLGPSFDSGIDLIVDKVKETGINKFGSFVIDVGNVMKFLDTIDQKLKTKLHREIVPANSFQLQAQILKGKAKDIREYLLVLLPDQALQFAKQSRSLNLNYSVIGGDVFADEQFLKEFILYIPETKLIYGVVEPWFAKAYKARFGNGSYLLEAASGYVFAQLAAQLVNQQNSKLNLQEKVRQIDFNNFAYKNAKIAGPGVRIIAPMELKTAQSYLQE